MHQGYGKFDDLACRRIKLAQELRAEIGIPNVSLRVGYGVMRQRFRTRQIVFRHNDLSRLSFGSRQGL